jgi:hypothetical protein
VEAATDRPPPAQVDVPMRRCPSLEAAREEAEQRKHHDDDQDDPENAHRMPPSVCVLVQLAPAENGYGRSAPVLPRATALRAELTPDAAFVRARG